MIVKLRLFLLLAGCILYLCAIGCGKHERTHSTTQDKSGMPEPLIGKPLTVYQYQKELLGLAFETASAIPVTPHIKDRSRAQEKVVAASLELDQPQQALSFIEIIDNWRRGAGYTDLAFYCAKHGSSEEALQYLNLAGRFSETAEGWRRDCIRIKIAKTYTLLGQTQKAGQFEMNVVDSEKGKVAQVRAMVADEDYFDEQMSELDAFIATGNLDIVYNSLKAYAALFNRFYDDAQRRPLVEEKIKATWDILPIFLRIELLTDLTGFALDHKDQSRALELVNDAERLFDNAQWPPVHLIKVGTKLNVLRFKAGDRNKARTDIDALLALFDLQRVKIVNIYRADVLRSLAEAYQSLGDTGTALMVYKRAVEEGIENPNSRPRAEDLSATCLSLAMHRVEPDDELWKRIREIKEGLKDPW